MSSIPNVSKSKYNKDDKFAWVDSQWEKFMTEQKELKAQITKLQEDLETCTKSYSRLWDKYAKEIDLLKNENKNLKEHIKTNTRGKKNG
tara:strand:- start:136 stop:402 length:267 start_codon:yes stop_codon:yes gene_type:complete